MRSPTDADDDEIDAGDSSSLLVRRREPESRPQLGDWHPTFASDTSTLVNWWGSFAILTLVIAIVFLVWPTWAFKNPSAGYMAAGWCAASTLLFAAVAYGFWRRHAWAGVAGIILPSISALSRLAAVILQFMINKPIKWNAGLQIGLSVWLAWTAWKWLKEQREMVQIESERKRDLVRAAFGEIDYGTEPKDSGSV